MIKKLLNKTIPIYPLISFRIGFGLLMLFGLVRTLAQGWVHELYVKPKFHFSFFGFDGLPRIGESAIYVLYAALIVAALFIAIGFLYRISISLFFLGFTYLELFDATNYLNHYYLICLFAFVLIFLPANKAYSLDAKLGIAKRATDVSAWTIYLIMAQIGIVYTFAGLAKLHPEWIVNAMPLTIWLKEREHWPILGSLFQLSFAPILFSILGAAYDLFIFWFLLFKKTRPMAYITVVVFHLITWSMFNIGLFPLIMIVSNIIFFSAAWHKKWLSKLGEIPNSKIHSQSFPKWAILYLCIQLILPIRFLFYKSQILWAEEGYRFSWRVMLVEKSGIANFTIKPKGKPGFEVRNSDFLMAFQEKQMAIQPDFILQYAKYLGRYFKRTMNLTELEVFVDSHVALNGRVSQVFVKPTINLLALEDSWESKTWVKAHPEL